MSTAFTPNVTENHSGQYFKIMGGVRLIIFSLMFWLGCGPQLLAANLDSTAKTELLLTTPENEGALTFYLKMFFEELGNRTGIKFTIAEQPKKRALVEAEAGNVDGLAARIKGLSKLGFQNLKVIDASHFTVQHVIFAKRQDIKDHVSDIQSLIEGAPRLKYKVAFLRGSKKAELLLADLPEEFRDVVKDPEEAFIKMQHDRLGVFLGGPGIVSRAILKDK
ncbi:MAG: hypothetical protein HON65_15585, partial [Rhodospirillales bacterium]|nr:hypothetical protein [Rhodospirillales bacterium]